MSEETGQAECQKRKLSLYIGVYTKGRTVSRLVDEIHVLNELGVSAVYIENNGGMPSELEVIEGVLEQVRCSKPKTAVGVNILPNFQGTEYEAAIKLAKTHGGNFIVSDLIAGRHIYVNDKSPLNGSTLPEVESERFLTLLRSGGNMCAIGGVATPYARLEGDLESTVKKAGQLCDAVMVKTLPGETEVPTERIKQYKVWSGRPVIVASLVDLRYMVGTVDLVRGYMVGGAGRLSDGRLNVGAIKDMSDFLKQSRDSSSGDRFGFGIPGAID